MVCASSGWRRLTVRVERAKLDYQKPLDRPFFSLALRAGDGRALEPVQACIIAPAALLQLCRSMRHSPPAS